MLDRARQRNILPPRSNPGGRIEPGEQVNHPIIPENLPSAADLGMPAPGPGMAMSAMNQQHPPLVPLLPAPEMSSSHSESRLHGMEGVDGAEVDLSPTVESSGVAHMSSGTVSSPSAFTSDLPGPSIVGMENLDNGSYPHSDSDRQHAHPPPHPARPSSASHESESNFFQHSDVSTANWIISDALLQDPFQMMQPIGVDAFSIPPWDNDMQRTAAQIW